MEQTPPPAPAYPLACGSLGPADRRLLARVAGRCGRELSLTWEGDGAALWTDRPPPIRWRAGECLGYAWAEGWPPPAAPPRDRRAAALAGLCGIAREGGRWLVHSSVSGIGPLYWTRRDGASYFCTRLEPLLELLGGRAEPDWQAWAAILTLGYPPGDRTPFRAIKRLPPMSALTTEGRVEREPWPWAEELPAPPRDPAGAILERLHAEIERLPPEAAVRLPLSGGWDSRLLAALLAAGARPVRAVTINNDRGTDKEERFAAQVAEILGVPHALAHPPVQEFGRELAATLVAQEHLSPPAVPMWRLGQALTADGKPLVDGLAGDILIREHYPVMSSSADWDDAVAFLWRKFVRTEQGHALLKPALWDAFESEGLAQLRHATAPFAGHPAGPALAMYATRTRRSTSQAPLDHLAQAGPVAMPFVADSVARTMIAIPLARKRDGSLYREILHRADPRLATVTSTNDPGNAEHGRPTPQRRRSPEALAAYEQLLRDHPLQPWFAPRLRQALERGELKAYVRGGGRVRKLYSLLSLGLWWRRHAHLLPPATDPGIAP